MRWRAYPAGELILKASCDFRVSKDDRGTLTAFDKFGSFDLKRFYVINCLKDKWRGSHYHKLSTQMILVIDGRLEVEITENGSKRIIEMLPGETFVQLPFVQFKFRSLEDNSSIIVLCDKEHDLSDYYSETIGN